MNSFLSLEIQYLILFTVVIILPKFLVRFRIPVGISCLFLGIATSFGLGWFDNDELLLMLSRLGITSLFLFAGMEVNIEELKQDKATLGKHLIKSTILIFATGFGLAYAFGIDYRPALILALGLMTPSAGFILNSLKNYNFTEAEEYWIRSKAISKEIVAILLLFVALQSNSMKELSISSAYLILLIAILPLVLKFFLKVIAPYAPDTEVGFLIIVALIAGVITKKIGAYYLVGAFIAGVVAGNFKHFVGEKKHEHILNSLAVFFSFFVPFYFYKAGLSLKPEIFSWKGLAIGVCFLSVFITLRTFSVLVTLKLFVKDFWIDRVSISMSLLPTLIFGLVIATILKEKFGIADEIISGLIIYTVVSSLIPSFMFKKAPPIFTDTSMGKADNQ